MSPHLMGHSHSYTDRAQTEAWGPLLSGGRRGAFLTIRQPAVYYVEPTYPFVYICGSGAGAMGQPWRLFAVQ